MRVREVVLGHGWLTEAVRARYREVWDAGLTGGCNLYRVTPLKPPVAGADAAGAAPGLPEIPRERLVVDVPTLVIWALDDTALDGTANALGHGFGGLSTVLRRIQTGYARSYALTMVAGVLLVGVVLILSQLG